jgi:predicted patatin/cPLA2 family phospholipase
MSEKNEKIKRALVVSGGGSFGAFGGGTLEGLNREYDIAAGISTGALLTPLALLGEYDVLREGYTNISDNDIFDSAWYKPKPMKKNGKINMWAIIYALIMGNPSFGTTKKMKKLIDKFMLGKYYNRLLVNKKEILVGTQNFQESPSELHYFSNMTELYEDFKDWMWFSANATFATSIVQKKWTDKATGKEYMGQWSDGGITEVIPIDPIIASGAKEIDIIVHRPKVTHEYQVGKINNLIEYVTEGVAAMRYDITFEHLYETCKHMADEHGITSRLYFLPRKLSNNSMVFNKKQMVAWWKEGYETCNDPDRIVEFKP